MKQTCILTEKYRPNPKIIFKAIFVNKGQEINQENAKK